MLALFIGLIALGRPCPAAVPLVSRMAVADVTPRSFSVLWVSSEPAVGQINLFQADCSTPVADSSIAVQASDRTGMIKGTVSGLDADTAYCYQTVTVSKYSSDTTLSPAEPAPVRTEKANARVVETLGQIVPFGNDLLRVPAPYVRPATGDVQDGVLVLLELLDGKGSSPLSLLLSSDGAGNYFNMNNLFDPVSGQNLNLTGGERVRVTEMHGNAGCASLVRFRKVPADMEVAGVRDLERGAPLVDIDCNDTINILDVIRVARSSGTADGDACYNSDHDMNGDGRVEPQDVETVIGGFSETP